MAFVGVVILDVALAVMALLSSQALLAPSDPAAKKASEVRKHVSKTMRQWLPSRALSVVASLAFVALAWLCAEGRLAFWPNIVAGMLVMGVYPLARGWLAHARNSLWFARTPLTASRHDSELDRIVEDDYRANNYLAQLSLASMAALFSAIQGGRLGIWLFGFVLVMTGATLYRLLAARLEQDDARERAYARLSGSVNAGNAPSGTA